MVKKKHKSKLPVEQNIYFESETFHPPLRISRTREIRMKKVSLFDGTDNQNSRTENQSPQSELEGKDNDGRIGTKLPDSLISSSTTPDYKGNAANNTNNTITPAKSSFIKETGKVKSLKFAVAFDGSDPLSKFPKGPRLGNDSSASSSSTQLPVSKKANLMIRLEDEIRIVASIHDASKRLTTGSIYSVVVDISQTGTLDIGVKDLNENVLAVSLLKRENDKPGAGEAAGIRLGDVIFGVNFIPTREGSKTLISIIRIETEKRKKFIHIQAWRCHQLCSDEIPGYLFPRANDMFVHSYSLYRTKVFNEWERWNFVEILLSHMIEDLRMLSDKIEGIEKNSSSVVKQKQMQVLDLERNILQAKGLRTSLNVRIVHTKFKDDAVSYVLRIEDIESGLHWSINRRYNEFFTLYEELREICPYTKELDFPRKRVAMKNSAKVVETRIVGLELYVRKALHTLTLYASMDNSASKGLRHLQQFLGVDRKIDCIHPPPMDDQRAIEIMAYQLLNDYNSPACQQCVRFINSVDLEAVAEPGEDGYRSLLTFLHDALAEVEQFVQQQHEQQLIGILANRRPDWTPDQRFKLARLCIRRQVESSLYLPLRRTVFRIVQSYVAERSRKLQRAISLLQQAKPSVFMVDYEILRTNSLAKTVKAFRKSIMSYLPVDQGQFLVESAKSITELHGEIRELKQGDVEEAKAATAMRNIVGNSSPLPIAFRKTSVSSIAGSDPLSVPTSPQLPRVPSDPDKAPIRMSITGIFGNQKIDRKPSLQERIKDFVQAEKSKLVSGTYDEDDAEVEDDNPLRVSFAVGPNLAIPYSNKRKVADKTLERGLKDLILSPSVSITPIKEETEQEKDPLAADYGDRTSFTSEKAEINLKTPESSSTISPTRRVSLSRPTSLLRKVSSEEMMNDPLLRPLAIELAGDSIDKSYFEEVFDRYSHSYTYPVPDTEEDMINNAISADDFLPLFTYVLVHANVPHLLLLKELMVALISNEDAYGECGYYLATMEAAIQHIMDIANQYEGIVNNDGFYEDNEEIFDLGNMQSRKN